MTPRLTLLDNDTIVVSPTQLEIIRTCPRMWLHRYLYRRVEVVADAAKQGGKAFDAALNLRYLRCGNRAVDAETEAMQCAIIDDAYKGVELPMEEFRTPARYKEVISDYNKHWGAEDFDVLGVQVPFAVELGRVPVPSGFWSRSNQYLANAQGLLLDKPPSDVGPRFIRVILKGILDLFIRSGQHVMIVDTKTSKSDIGSSYDNSAQMKAYMWALPELARANPDAGLPTEVHAARINGVIIRPPYKNEGRVPKPGDRARNEFVRTFPQFYTAERLEEWRRDSLTWVEQALGWVARDHYPQNERHCTFHQDAAFTNYGYYGKPCPYLQVCSLPAAQREDMLASDVFEDYGRGPV